MNENIVTTDIKQIKFEKFNKAFTIINVVIASLFTLLFLVLFILVESGLVRLVISGIWLISNVIWIFRGAEKKHFLRSTLSCIFIPVTIMMMSVMIAGVHSDSPWRYNLQLDYVKYYKSHVFKVAPEKLPDDISDYGFHFVATLGQGAGHSSVRFKASQDVIKAYEEEYSAKAIYTYPYSEFEHGYSIYVDEISPKASATWEDDKSLYIYSDTDFWAESTSATVYVTSATHNWNHPHSTAVIIDSEKNMIEFAQLG